MALLLSVISGPDERDGTSALGAAPDFLAALRQPLHPGRPLRIGWCPDFGEGSADAEMLNACEAAVERLHAQGCTVVPVAPWLITSARQSWEAEFYAGIANRIASVPDAGIPVGQDAPATLAGRGPVACKQVCQWACRSWASRRVKPRCCGCWRRWGKPLLRTLNATLLIASEVHSMRAGGRFRSDLTGNPAKFTWKAKKCS